MKKYYRTIMTDAPIGEYGNEWTDYEGFDLETAKRAWINGSDSRGGYRWDIYVYEVPDDFDELGEDEQKDILCELDCCGGDSAVTPAMIAKVAGVSVATVYSRAKKLGRLPTIKECKSKPIGRPRKY